MPTAPLTHPVPGEAPLRGRLLGSLPPVRLLWLGLGALTVYGILYFGNGTGVPALFVVPAVGAAVDLAFQRVRFGKVRFPDAALATGLFLALIFPPTAPLVFAAASTGAAVTLRHLLRSRGHPWFNPAATGAVLGGVLFGLAPAWWVAVGVPVGPVTTGELAMLAVGAVLLARSLATWRLPAAFFSSFAALYAVQHLLVGATVEPRVLLLGVTDPVTVFFGLFMVAEPRTAPRWPRSQTLYAGVVGVAAALFPTFAPSLGLFLALLLGNGLSVALRASAARSETTAVATPAAAGRRAMRAASLARRPTAPVASRRWPVGTRVGVGFLAILAIAAVAIAGGVGPSPAPVFQIANPGAGAGGLASCAHDNTSISASTLSTLHRTLGPSVILSYDAATGVVVFFDPVHQVTVTETDLYEDYGSAEFNGDDFAVGGCAA
jgi:Na+-translocating ferredoxin:NAD+ oxidoreductase RnfD subunit